MKQYKCLDEPKDLKLKNNSFKIFNDLFLGNGWDIIKNEINLVEYTKFGYETDVYEISLDKNYIKVSIPIKNSSFQYKTYFIDFFSAYEYVENMFNYYNM